MESPFGEIRSQIIEALQEALLKLGYKDGVSPTVTESKTIGDISSSIAFKLAKELKKPPNEIAKSIMPGIKGLAKVEKITADNGYINFHLDRMKFSAEVVAYASALKPGKPLSDTGKGKRVMIEYPSVNPNKPWHIGQLRNALLGDCVSNIHGACYYDVEREDYIDDLGLQVAQSLWGFMKHKEEPKGKFDFWMGEQYVKASKESENESVKKEVAKTLSLMEQDGTYESKLGRELAEKVVAAQYDTAFAFGIYHDVMVWEGDIVRNMLLKKSLDHLLKSKHVKKMESGEFENCIVINLSSIPNLPEEFKGLKEPVKVLIRSDGTPTYVAKDIAFHMWKFGMLDNTFNYKPFIGQPNGKQVYTTTSAGKRMDFGSAQLAINIIDVKQSFPQALLKLAFEIMGRKDIADGIVHLAYGRVDIEGGTLSGRQGTWLEYTADRLLEETISKASTLITERSKLTKSEKENVSNRVALSAIKFEFLKFAPESGILFSWESALNFEGNSGPYCQYMFARATRLLEDSRMTREQLEAVSTEALADNEAFELVKLLSKTKEVVEKTCAEVRPNVLTDHAISLAVAFSTFYESSPILKAGFEKERPARLALTFAFANTMAILLRLLGIEPIERM